MIVYWVAAAEILFYLSAVPLHLALLLRAEKGAAWGVGFALFDERAARRSAIRKMRGRDSGRKEAGSRGLPLSTLRRVRVERVSLTGSVALGDAAATALACGALEAMGYSLRARAEAVSVRVTPDFNSADIRVRLRGMIRVRAGQIIRAAMQDGLDHIVGRIAPWKNAPLKAS